MAIERFERLLLWSVPLGLLTVIGAGRWMVGRALAPLVRLAEATRSISITNLQQRLPVRGAGDELDEVSLAFNDLLARQEQAIGEMRQFSAALAHELRTPLAVLRGETELALRHPGSLEEQRRHLTSQLEEFDKLSRLIGQLLTLARAEAGEIRIARERVDLSRCAASIVEQLEPVAEARGIALSCQSSNGDQIVVIGDAGWLERLLLILLDNAIKFTPEQGRVSLLIASRRSDSQARRTRQRTRYFARDDTAPLRAILSGRCCAFSRDRWCRTGTGARQVDRRFPPRGHRGDEPAGRGEHVHRAPAPGPTRRRAEARVEAAFTEGGCRALFFTGGGAPPPPRTDADASPRISMSSARHGRGRASSLAAEPRQAKDRCACTEA